MSAPETLNNALVIGITGSLLLAAALFASSLKKLPVSTAMIYLAAGVGVGPLVAARLGWELGTLSGVLEHITEFAILISLFIAGMKVGMPTNSGRWRIPLRLASVSMVITVALVAVLSMWLLNLPLGAGVLLGAMLAPTDPVLATEVQVQDRHDRDQLRINLSGEAALNDGTAFPFVMLGLGLLGLHDLGDYGWRWLAVDVLWATLGGVALGALCGLGTSRVVLHLRSTHRMALGYDEFIAMGLVALTYSLSLLTLTYGFLAVFAAAYMFARTAENTEGKATEAGADASASLAVNALGFNEQLERIGELLLVLLIGCLLWTAHITVGMFVLAALLLCVVRPLAVWLGLLGANAAPLQQRMTAWFGIRGIGSVFYLAYAVQHGLPAALVDLMSASVLVTVALSITLHGATVTPLMRSYARRKR